MRQPFVLKHFKVPQKVDFNNYFAVPILTKDAVEDWIVVTSNASMIMQLRGGGSYDGWPHKYPLEENYKDLAWLEICANYKQLFSYIIRNRGDNSYVGCLYIYPIEIFYPNLAGKYDVDFSFWITKKEYDKGVYEEIFKEILNWMETEWGFAKERIYLRNAEIPPSLKVLKDSR